MDTEFKLIIGVMVFVFVLLIILVVSRFKRYSDGAKVAGDALMKLAVPKKQIFSNVIFYLAVAYIFNGHGISGGGIDLSAILILAIGFINLSFDIKPQVVCEYGIMTSNGLYPWEVIKQIDPVDEMDDTIKAKLQKMPRENSELKLYVEPGTALEVVRLIESRIERNVYDL